MWTSVSSVMNSLIIKIIGSELLVAFCSFIGLLVCCVDFVCWSVVLMVRCFYLCWCFGVSTCVDAWLFLLVLMLCCFYLCWCLLFNSFIDALLFLLSVWFSCWLLCWHVCGMLSIDFEWLSEKVKWLCNPTYSYYSQSFLLVDVPAAAV
jgi:hypothetical protein